jgi:subtilase family serine protease
MSLDLDMASVGCGNCRVLLVEATSSSLTDIGAAEQTAANMGANAISNSFSTQGELGTTAYDFYFNHAGVAVTASTGDNGYVGGWPSDIPTVIGVGGTSLSRSASGSRGWVESAWSGGGSWCSGYESEPAWQQGLVKTDPSGSVCVNRTTADVSADADPNTGVAVYDTYSQPGWLEVGGTSVSSPLIASLYAAAGDALGNSSYPYPAKWTYAHAGSLNDVTGGSNGSCWPANSDPYYLCHAVAGYDGPTGLGTPNGLGAL